MILVFFESSWSSDLELPSFLPMVDVMSRSSTTFVHT